MLLWGAIMNVEPIKQGLRGAGYALVFMAIGAAWGIVHESDRLSNPEQTQAMCAAAAAPLDHFEPVKKKLPPPKLDSSGIKLNGKGHP